MVQPIYADELTTNNVRHGFFTRSGGVSTGIYKGLNCGYGSGDDKTHVTENRKRIADFLQIPEQNLITPYQEHTNIAVTAIQPWQREDAPVADAIVTNQPGLAIAVLTADCAPVLFADDQAKIVAAAHAGWRGAKGGILMSTVYEMEQLGAQRDYIVAAIGPCLCQDSYEVGQDFLNDFIADSRNNRQFFDENSHPKPRFDLPAYVRSKLHELGVTIAQGSDNCTYTAESLFYSYRRSVHKNEGDYGRQLSAIMLR